MRLPLWGSSQYSLYLQRIKFRIKMFTWLEQNVWLKIKITIGYLNSLCCNVLSINIALYCNLNPIIRNHHTTPFFALHHMFIQHLILLGITCLYNTHFCVALHVYTTPIFTWLYMFIQHLILLGITCLYKTLFSLAPHVYTSLCKMWKTILWPIILRHVSM